MSIPKDAKCCGYVHRGRWGVSVCAKPAKMEHEGGFYCGIHDPVKAKAKRDAVDARWQAELAAQRKAKDEAAAKQAALELDAARYRWLRRFDHFAQVDEMLNSTEFNTLDAAVDAAMKG